ncbi:hypothetical protein Sjap_005253 [Stephania japonica]|uniref:Response regulatory domain-containing protein n=1 Tax=Stephania japonica TaxID=461633 RepID=A0AAP0K644_9MAGN
MIALRDLRGYHLASTPSPYSSQLYLHHRHKLDSDSIEEQINCACGGIYANDYLRHKTALSAIGVDSIEANNGEEALDLYRSGAKFDTIIMDMDMPRMEGIRTTVLLRGIGVRDKILGVTSRSRETELQALMDLGLDYCEELPLTLAKLVSIVQEIDNNLG